MYYSDAIVSKMISDDILAKKLDNALVGVKDQVLNRPPEFRMAPPEWLIICLALLIIIRMFAQN